MADPTTDERLAAIREREKAATPSRWFVKSTGYGMERLTPRAIVSSDTDSIDWTAADYAFVAAARADVPWLLAEVERLSAIVKGMAGAKRIYNHPERGRQWCDDPVGLAPSDDEGTEFDVIEAAVIRWRRFRVIPKGDVVIAVAAEAAAKAGGGEKNG